MLLKKHIATSISEYIFENNNNKNHKLPEYWYHGSNKYFDKFSLDFLGKNYEQSILGIYFSQYIKPGIYGSTAKEYAQNLVVAQGGKPYIYKCKLNSKNPLILNSNDWYSSNTFIDKNRNDLIRYMNSKNYDCLIVYNFEEYENDGMQYADFIAVTNKIEIIEIVEIFEFKN